VCGKTSIDALALRASPVRTDLRATPELILSLPGRLRAEQTTFSETGGLHAAALFNAEGKLLCAREDVGRHNAVDKVFGWALANPKMDLVLCVSGRLSFEIVQKAIVFGVPLVAAVSAPSSLAIDLAERFQVTLCGFVRGDRFNIYSHRFRVAA
jgi:FdhD protein